MPTYRFEYIDEPALRSPVAPVEVEATADIEALAMRAAHEAAWSLAPETPSGRVVVIARAEDGSQAARAVVTWSNQPSDD